MHQHTLVCMTRGARPQRTAQHLSKIHACLCIVGHIWLYVCTLRRRVQIALCVCWTHKCVPIAKRFLGALDTFLSAPRICADGDGDAASRIISLRHAASHVARRERSAKCTRWVIMTLCTRLSATLPASRSRTVPRFQWQSNWDTSSSYRQCTRRWGRLNYSRCWEYANSVISDSFHSSWSFQIKAKLSWIIIKFPIKCVPSPFARFKCGSHKQNITEFCFCT